MSDGSRAGRMKVPASPNRPARTAMRRSINLEFDRALAAQVEILGLSGFETRADCEERQRDMLQRLGATGVAPPLWQDIAQCTVDHCARDACVEGCHFGTLKRRRTALETGLPIMAAHPGPHWAVTIVYPLWEVPVGKLADISVAAAGQWNNRRLRSLAVPGLLAIGSFEVSLNRELDGSLHWAGEIQQIVAGASYEELRRAFQIEGHYRDANPDQHMVDVRKFGNLNRKFAYGQKRLVEERRAYISNATGRQDRNHLPPPGEHWAEHDAWLLGLPLGARIIAFGCGRRGTTFTARK